MPDLHGLRLNLNTFAADVSPIQRPLRFFMVSKWCSNTFTFLLYCRPAGRSIRINIGLGSNGNQMVRYAVKKKKRHYLGIFPNMGGGLPKSQNFCKFTKYFFVCQIHSEVLKHVLQMVG